MSTYEFEEHIVKLQPGMYAAAYSLTAAPEDAKDLVQDTILRAFTNLHRFVDHSNFKGWIHTIMRNLYISNYHRAKHRTVTIDYNDETPHPAVYNETPHDMPHGAVVSQTSMLRSVLLKMISASLSHFSSKVINMPKLPNCLKSPLEQ